MLLVVGYYVSYERTFTREESGRSFQRLSMPHLRLLLLPPLFFLKLSLPRTLILSIKILLIIQKPQLRSNTEIRHSQQNNLGKHSIPRKLMRVIQMQIHFLMSQRLQMHDIANVQVEDPVVLLG